MVELNLNDQWKCCKQLFDTTVHVGKEPTVQQWNPRSKAGAAIWRTEIDDLLVWHGLREAAVGGPPTFEECSKKFAAATNNQLQELLRDCERHYSALNKQISQKCELLSLTAWVALGQHFLN